MTTQTVNSPIQATAVKTNYKIGYVTSKDGTVIGYRQLGDGPGVVLLHGSMESAQSHMQLGEALADKFSVYLPDRRGRGMSGPHGDHFSLQKEVDDLEALLAKTNASYLLGVSSGAIVALQAALTLPTIRKAVIFEPPLSVNGSLSTEFVARYDSEIAEGKIVSAMVTGMLGAQMGPAIFQRMPRWFLELMTQMMLRSEDKNAAPDEVTMRKLAPTIHYDFQLAIEVADKQERFSAITADILLLGGSDSPTYLKVALDTLEKVLPKAKRVELSGIGHGATGNKNRGGQPERVAEVLQKFFV